MPIINAYVCSLYVHPITCTKLIDLLLIYYTVYGSSIIILNMNDDSLFIYKQPNIPIQL